MRTNNVSVDRWDLKDGNNNNLENGINIILLITKKTKHGNKGENVCI